jgi:hypothetical protein
MLLNRATLVLAKALLRTCSPLRAHRIMRRVGTFLPSIRSTSEAREAVRNLSRHGSCLARSLAVAARMPEADIAIGVSPDSIAPLSAHAWIEIDGVSIEPTEVVGSVIARLRSTM